MYRIMSGISNYTLNQKINAILGKTSGLPSVINLDTTLTTGNNAGANDIDMNNNDILQVNNIDLTTINGLPPAGAENLDQTLTIGNNAGANDIDMNGNDILQVNNIDLTTINGGAYPPTIPTPADLSIPTGVLQGTATTYNGSTAVTISAKPPFAYYSDLGTIPSPIIAPATTYAFDFLGVNAFNGMPFITTRAKFCLLPQTGYYKVTARVNLGQSAFVGAGVNSLFLQVQINGVNSMAENYGSVTPFNGFGAFPATCYFQLVCDTIVSVSAVDGTNNKLSCLISNSATGNSTIQYQMISIHKISDL